MSWRYVSLRCIIIIIIAFLLSIIPTGNASAQSSFIIYDEQDPLTFTGGWGWDGFQASRTTADKYTGTYSYAVTIPSGINYSSEGWTGPLPNTTGANRLVFAYRKTNPNSIMLLYFYVNGYWHQVVEGAGTGEYQGWVIPKASDTLWHEVVIDLSAETQGYNGDPDVAPTGQLGNFEIAVYNQTPGDTIYFDSIRFEKMNDMQVFDEQDPSTFTGGWGWDGFQASRTTADRYTGTYSYAVTIPSGLNYSSEGWAGPLPGITGANRLVFAYRKTNPNSSMLLYFYVNGYWHQVVEGVGIGEYQGWTIPKVSDTLWHEVVIDLSTETQGYNGDPDVAPTGQLGNFEIAVYNQTPGDTIYFDSIRFETVSNMQVYDEQDPLTFTGGWGWDGFQASRTTADRYTGTYSYAVTIPSGLNYSSEGWTGPLPDTTRANRLIFAYRKSNPNSYMIMYFYVNGYWHKVTEQGIGLDYQGWTIQRVSDTLWHEVVIDLSTETQGYNGDPDVAPTGQLGNFAIAIYNETPGDTIYFDSIRFETVTESDTTPPTGTISINSGAAYTRSTAVTLTLSCSDTSSGCSQMRFSNDNATWSTWEAYGTSKIWTLASGDGTKTVYVQYRDNADNSSISLSDTISLDTAGDTAGPTGTISINSGAAYTSSIAVTLTLSCFDSSSGCSQMRISNDNATWSTWEVYATSKIWTLASGDGTKTVYVQYRDNAGNSSISLSDTITLNTNQAFYIYDEEDPSTFTGGWGWDGFQATWTTADKYTGTYSYAVTIPSGRTDSSEGWTGPLPDTTGANRLIFAYRKSNPSSYMIIYFYVNGYWHKVAEQGIGLDYQGWTIPRVSDTLWHEVIIDLSTETQGTNGDPDVAPAGQLGNFEIAVYNQAPGDTIYFDSIRFEKMNDLQVYDEEDPNTFTGGWGIDGFQASWTSGVAYNGSYSYAVTIPDGRTDSSEGWTNPLPDNSIAERLVFAYRKTNPNSTMFIKFMVSGKWHQVIEGTLPSYIEGWAIPDAIDSDWHQVIIELAMERTDSLLLETSPWGKLTNFEIGVEQGNPGDTIYFDNIRFEMPPIQAYVSSNSVDQGGSINFHVSTKYSSYDVNIYREGASKELVASIQGLPGQSYPIPEKGYETGFNWPEAFTLQIPSNWKSGVYVAEILSGQDKAYTLFVVKESLPGRTSSILFKLSVNTYQAYNRAGGKALYEHVSSENVRAMKVSLDRPYADNFGAGQFYKLDVDWFGWEFDFIRWLESNGYTVEYVTDVDIHAATTLLYNYKLLLSVGHDEYWSKEMRDNVESFISNGGNVAFFSGNTSWWQVRFENNNRTMVCYKWPYYNDPLFGVDNSRVTWLWYDYPVNRPENWMTGVSWRNGGYVNIAGYLPASEGYGGYKVYNSTHWVYQGAGLMDGQEFGQPETIVGYEVDGALLTFQNGIPVVTGEDGTPLNFIILGLSDSVKGNGTPGYATMGIYTKPGGGTVFTAATTDWAFGLATNTHVQQITGNIINTLSR